MVRPKLVKPRGILHARVGDPGPGYARYWPADDLAPLVEHFWRLVWDLPEPGQAEVLSHPSVHLAFERGRSGVNGVVTGRFTRRLEGKGRILGVKFRPGGFRPFLGGPVSTLTDRTVPVGEVFGSAGATLEEHVLAQADDGAAFELVQSFLRGRQPVADETVELVGRITDRVASDREITRVEHLVRELGIGTRKLQRLFDDYVGVSPKWVIQRYRLHEAAERIALGTAIDWAALALDLGYADQAHFIRDFRRLVGRSPASYAKAF
ncbi:MAG TPA: helix-turn-helix domain-containing protein [Thermoanaerobaculia bacterium]|jgi:AraC-like DNA-binding protein|nr:helix-turn-helix domain-containing protein [Thermoanaerobaculia bacterium]